MPSRASASARTVAGASESSPTPPSAASVQPSTAASAPGVPRSSARACRTWRTTPRRSEEHTSELQSLRHLVCRLLLEKKKNKLALAKLGRDWYKVNTAVVGGAGSKSRGVATMLAERVARMILGGTTQHGDAQNHNTMH